MKIGIFTDAYAPLISGVATSIDILSKELRKMNHEVYVITFELEDPEPDNYVIRFKGRKLPMKGLNQYRIAKVKRKDVKSLEKYNFDVVHIHTEFTMGRLGRRYAKKYNVPIVYTYHTMYEDYVHFISPIFKGALRRLVRGYTNSFIKSVDQSVFPTIKVKKAFDGFGYKGTAEIVPTGIYTERFRKINFLDKDVAKLKVDLGMEPDDFVLLFLGRISREKSLEQLIDQFAKLAKIKKKIKLLLVGWGPDADDFKAQVAAHGIEDKVIFAGMVPPSKVAYYYQVGDVFVNFSMTETQGLTYIEALASGLPLLVKYDDNLEDVMENGVNGFSFNEDDEFVPLFSKMTDNKLLLEKLTNNTTKSIKKFSAETFAKSMARIYQNTVDNKKE